MRLNLVRVNIVLTKEQAERFKEFAKKYHDSISQFIHVAAEEWMENGHNGKIPVDIDWNLKSLNDRLEAVESNVNQITRTLGKLCNGVNFPVGNPRKMIEKVADDIVELLLREGKELNVQDIGGFLTNYNQCEILDGIERLEEQFVVAKSLQESGVPKWKIRENHAETTGSPEQKTTSGFSGVGEGEHVEPSGIASPNNNSENTNGVLINEFLVDCRARLSPSTVRNYTKILEAYEKFLDGKNVEDATIQDVRNFLNRLKEKGRGRGTIGCYLGAIKSCYSFLEYCKGIVPPKLGQIKAREYRRENWEGLGLKPLSRAEVRALIDAPDSLRDSLLIALLYYTGTIASEIANLRIQNVNTERRIIEVFSKGYYRRVCYPHTIDKSVESWLTKERKSYVTSGGSNYFFVGRGGGKLSRSTISDIVHKAAEKAGIQKVVAVRADGTKICRVKPRALRRSFVLHAIENGVPSYQIRRMLGLRSMDATTEWELLDWKKVEDEYLKSFYEKYKGV